MRKFHLHKLVRDKILFNMEASGQHVLYRSLTEEAYLKALVAKLVEEAEEVNLISNKHTIDELTDVIEVAETLASALGTNYEALRSEQLKKREQRGGFNDRIFIESVEVSENDKWVEYYAKDPIKFPEIK